MRIKEGMTILKIIVYLTVACVFALALAAFIHEGMEGDDKT